MGRVPDKRVGLFAGKWPEDGDRTGSTSRSRMMDASSKRKTLTCADDLQDEATLTVPRQIVLRMSFLQVWISFGPARYPFNPRSTFPEELLIVLWPEGRVHTIVPALWIPVFVEDLR